MFGPSRVRQGVFLLVGGEAVTRLLGFLLSAVIAREFGLEALAALTVAQGLVAFALVAGDGGLSTDGVRRLAGGELPRARLIALTTVGQVALTVSATSVLLVVVAVLPLSTQTKQVVLVLALLPMTYALNLGWVLQSASRFFALTTSRVAGQAAGMAVGLVCLYYLDSFLLAVASLVLGSAVTDVLLALHSRRDWRGPGRLSGRAVVQRVRQGRGFLGYTLANHASSAAPLLMTAFVGSAAVVGQYSVAHRLLLLAVAPAQVFASVLLPRFSSTPGALRSDLWAPVSALVVLTAGASSALVVFARPIAEALFGAAAGSATPAVQLVGLFIPLSYTSLLLTTALLAEGRAGTQARYTALSLGMFVALAALLVPAFGARGPLYAILVTETFAVILVARTLQLRATRLVGLGAAVMSVLGIAAGAGAVADICSTSIVLKGVVWAVATPSAVFVAIRALGGPSPRQLLVPRPPQSEEV